MKIRIVSSMAGPRINWPAGSVVDLPSAKARGLIKAGAAEPYREDETETAVDEHRETAVKRGPGRPRKRV
jgi:hypothetical protein